MVHVEKSAGMPYVLALMAVSGCTGDPAEPSGGGNFGAAAALRARLQGRAAPAAAAVHRKETVVLPQVDAQGRAVPGAFGRDAAGAGGSHPTPIVMMPESGLCPAFSVRMPLAQVSLTLNP